MSKDKMKIVGYSERGAVNALFYGIALLNSKDEAEEKLKKFLRLAQFDDYDKYSEFELYMEFSLSEFGEPDLVIIAQHENKGKTVFFVEAKVSDCGTYKLKKGALNNYFTSINECNTSNLFFQLKLKELLYNKCTEYKKCERYQENCQQCLEYENCHKILSCEKWYEREYEPDKPFNKITMTKVRKSPKHPDVSYRSIGNNPVVRKFVDKIKECNSAQYIAIIPDPQDITIDEAKEEKIDLDIHYITWEKIEEVFSQYILETLNENEGIVPEKENKEKIEKKGMCMPISKSQIKNNK